MNFQKPHKKHRQFTCQCGATVHTISRVQKYCKTCAAEVKLLTAKLYAQQRRHG